jgi:hypothetical protein
VRFGGCSFSGNALGPFSAARGCVKTLTRCETFYAWEQSLTSMNHRTGLDRSQTLLFPERLEDYVAADNPVRFLDAFVGSLHLHGLGFAKARCAEAKGSLRSGNRSDAGGVWGIKHSGRNCWKRWDRRSGPNTMARKGRKRRWPKRSGLLERN